MIRTEDCRRRHTFAEVAALGKMVNACAKAMKAKLRDHYRLGYHGWDDPKDFPTEVLWIRLEEHVKKRQALDIANFAAMIWNREQP